MQPSIQFVTTADGVRVAYSVCGSGRPLVLVRPWVSHLQLLWDDPAFSSFFGRLARHFLLVRYDGRGNGLSQRDVSGVTFDHLLLDLETVAAHLDLRDITFFGDTFGGAVCIAYTARHPERVARLILHGAYARGSANATPEQAASIIAAVRNLPDAKRLLTHYTFPGDEEAAHRRVPMHEIISRRVAAELYTLAFQIDVSDLLPGINVPALVIHRRRSMTIPFAAATELASHLPDARLVALEGREHNAWEGDSAPALAAISDFLGVDLGVPMEEAPAGASPLTVLFTDMEESTALTQRHGDEKAQEIVRAHNRLVRQALKTHGGSEIKHTGDGIMASFASASSAITAAIAIQRGFDEHNASNPALAVRVRIGLNAGEPVAEEGDLFGTAVQLAARVRDHAKPGQIIASDVVRQLVAGKLFLFSDLGEVALRGFEDPVRLFELRWQE